MKFRLLLLFAFISFNFSFAQNFTEYHFKFEIKDKSELNELTKIISIDKVIGNTVFAYSTNLTMDKFLSLNYDYSLIQTPKNSKADVATTIEGMANWNKYPTYDVYVEMMNHYASTYPDICKLINIGTTVNGRSLLALKISDNVNIEENEPEFFYTSTMHGDETTGFALMLRLIDSLATNYGSITEITDLINNIELYINPNANPDGTYGSDNNTILYPSRYNANGIDLNRNFPCPSQGDHPDNKDWQPETIAMMEFAKNNRITVSANFHGGAELANYPWDNNYRRHADDDWFIRVSRNYATSCQENSPSGYFTQENNGITHGADWYVTHGSRQDYYTYFENSREITFEISDIKTVSASSLPDYWNYNKEALFQFMRECLYGISGTVKDSNGNPLNAMIKIQDHDIDLDSSMVFTDPEVGDYHRPIEAGTYNIIASADGYISDTIKNITVTSNTVMVVNFILNSLTLNQKSLKDTLFSNETSATQLIFSKAESTNYTLEIQNPETSTWVSVNKTSGTLESNVNDTIIVSLNAKNIGIGNFETNIILKDADNTLAQIPVNLYVKDTIAALISSEFIYDTLDLGDSSIHKFVVRNIGNQELEYSISIDFPTKSDTWIKIDKQNGVVPLNGVDTINTYLYAKTSGDASCLISITEQDGDKRDIPINLHVKIIESTTESMVDLSNITIYPNPFKNSFRIELNSNKSDNAIISIYDLIGIKIWEKSYALEPESKNQIDIDLTGNTYKKFIDGIYFVEIIAQNTRITKKILKN